MVEEIIYGLESIQAVCWICMAVVGIKALQHLDHLEKCLHGIESGLRHIGTAAERIADGIVEGRDHLNSLSETATGIEAEVHSGTTAIESGIAEGVSEITREFRKLQDERAAQYWSPLDPRDQLRIEESPTPVEEGPDLEPEQEEPERVWPGLEEV